MTYDYRTEYEERRKASEKAERDYWTSYMESGGYTLLSHPFQGPDKLPRTIKIGGTERHVMVDIHPKPWKPAKTATTTSTAHVELSQRVFRDPNTGWEFTFWALAPKHREGWRQQNRREFTEFVWLVLDGTNGRGVHHALVDTNTGEIKWWDKIPAHYVPAEEVAS